VTVYRDGRIARKGRFPNSVRETVNASLPALLKLAEAEGFFCLPADIKGHRRNVDNGPVFITVYTGNGKKTVTLEPTGRNQRFSELYSVLMDLVSRGSG